jgi:peptidoglycan hydrolase-like protein with peptidoglycan-binding domain
MFRRRMITLVLAGVGVLLTMGVFATPAAAAIPQPHSAACLALGKRTYTKDGLAIVIPTTQVSRGSRGACVYYVQEMLSSHGYDISVDGIFGPQTESLVRRFQRGVLRVDGIVGKNTWWQLMIIN